MLRVLMLSGAVAVVLGRLNIGKVATGECDNLSSCAHGKLQGGVLSCMETCRKGDRKIRGRVHACRVMSFSCFFDDYLILFFGHRHCFVVLQKKTASDAQASWQQVSGAKMDVLIASSSGKADAGHPRVRVCSYANRTSLGSLSTGGLQL